MGNMQFQFNHVNSVIDRQDTGMSTSGPHGT